MHADVLVLIHAHLIRPRTNVELTVVDLNIIWLLACGYTNGLMELKLNKSINTIGHRISELYEITGAHGHGGLVGFGFINRFLCRGENGEILKAWEDSSMQWQWRRRKYGEKK